MFRMLDVGDMVRSRCRMMGMWDVRDVECSRRGMIRMLCGMFEMWDVRDVGC